MEVTGVPTDEWMDRENMAYANNRIAFSFQKEGDATVCDNMNEPGEHNIKQNKPVIKGQILHDCTYMNSLKQLNLQKQEE